jgi:BirA family biotin operon repressor/biotin-[acetyl-CoA-carboxylase] ligase
VPPSPSASAELSPPLLILDEIDSTNAEARRRAEGGEPGPLWIAARRQTAGRGRQGRTWETAAQNLAATLLTRTDKPAAEAAQISFVAALAVADLAREYVPASLVALKWPNDVLLGGEKLSGVLIESGPSGQGLWLAVGIGVNLASAPSIPDRPATHLAAHLKSGVVRPPTLEEALAGLAKAFDRWSAVWHAQGFGPVRQAWNEAAAGLGRPCVARPGSETVQGVAEALEEDGALRLRLADGSVRRITAGDVFFPNG